MHAFLRDDIQNIILKWRKLDFPFFIAYLELAFFKDCLDDIHFFHISKALI